MRTTIQTLQAKKAAGEKFSVVSAWDASFARLIDAAGIEVVLVGDSLGMVVQGRDSTLPVTLEQMSYHTAAVARGNTNALVIADLPFATYPDPERALESAAALMRAGAEMVKLEGGAWLAPAIERLLQNGIPVCAHLGLTPQSVHVFGGFRVQGREPDAAARIEVEARLLQDAGAALLVLECVPRALARRVSEQLEIPVIGIGAGADTDAQVLVLYDMLGLNPRPPRFVHDFLADTGSVPKALAAFKTAVAEGRFPAPEHGFD